MATQTLKRCPKSTCIASVGFQQMLFTGPGTHCPHCGSKLELVAPPRSRSAKQGRKQERREIRRRQARLAGVHQSTRGNKKKPRKVAQKKMQFKTWDLFLKPEPRKSAPHKDRGRQRGSYQGRGASHGCTAYRQGSAEPRGEN